MLHTRTPGSWAKSSQEPVTRCILLVWRLYDHGQSLAASDIADSTS